MDFYHPTAPTIDHWSNTPPTDDPNTRSRMSFGLAPLSGQFAPLPPALCPSPAESPNEQWSYHPSSAHSDEGQGWQFEQEGEEAQWRQDQEEGPAQVCCCLVARGNRELTLKMLYSTPTIQPTTLRLPAPSSLSTPPFRSPLPPSSTNTPTLFNRFFLLAQLPPSTPGSPRALIHRPTTNRPVRTSHPSPNCCHSLEIRT